MDLLIDELMQQTGLRPEILNLVVTRTIAHLHRGFHERCGQNGDYAGGQLVVDIGNEAFLHFIGILVCLGQDYFDEAETGELIEYAQRIVPRDQWEPVQAEIATWKSRGSRDVNTAGS